jgi:hypothetical protein
MSPEECEGWRGSAGQPWRVVESDAPLGSPLLRELRDYWLTARGDRAMPAREDVDPIDIPRLLPHLLLVEVHENPQRFRYRVVGTELTRLADRDPTGRWLDRDLYGDDLERVLVDFRACADTGAPVASRDTTMYLPNDWIVIEALLLPLGGPDGHVAMILVGIDKAHGADAPPNRDTVTLLDWRK